MGPRTGVGGPTAEASFPRPSWVSYTVTCHSADAWPRFEGPAAHSGHTSPWLPGQSQVCLLTSGSPTCPGPPGGSLKYPQVYTPGAHSQGTPTLTSNPPSPDYYVLWGPPSAGSWLRPPRRLRTDWSRQPQPQAPAQGQQCAWFWFGLGNVGRSTVHTAFPLAWSSMGLGRHGAAPRPAIR